MGHKISKKLISWGASKLISVLSKPGVTANIKDILLNIGKSEEELDNERTIPAEAIANAKKTVAFLKENGCNLDSLAIAVDAVPGAGKTSLAMALAHELGYKVVSLDKKTTKADRLLGTSSVDYHRDGSAPRAILEHNRLLMNYNPDEFDCIILIKNSIEQTRRQLLKRGHAAIMIEMMDYSLWQMVSDEAFLLTNGPAGHIEETNILLKIRPKEGFLAEEIVGSRLKSIGIDPDKLSRQQKLLSIVTKKRNTGSGWLPFLKPEVLDGLFSLPEEFLRKEKDD